MLALKKHTAWSWTCTSLKDNLLGVNSEPTKNIFPNLDLPLPVIQTPMLLSLDNLLAILSSRMFRASSTKYRTKVNKLSKEGMQDK